MRAVRKALAMTQAELAEAIGLETSQAVSNLERGESSVTPERARRLAQLSGKPASHFLVVDAEVTSWPESDRIGRLVEQVEGLEGSVDELLKLVRLLPQAPVESEPG